jgi:hypothetical protein
MPAALYMDVHVPQAVTEQLLRRRVDVLTAIEDEADRRPDDELLAHASALGRIVVTFDIRFLAMAEQWQRSGPRVPKVEEAFVGERCPTMRHFCGVLQSMTAGCTCT